jgi:hypothetical protein
MSAFRVFDVNGKVHTIKAEAMTYTATQIVFRTDVVPVAIFERSQVVGVEIDEPGLGRVNV